MEKFMEVYNRMVRGKTIKKTKLGDDITMYY